MTTTGTENLTVEQLESALRVRRATERLAELEKNLGEFKKEVNSAVGLTGVFQVCSRFVARVNNAHAGLKPKQAPKSVPKSKKA